MTPARPAPDLSITASMAGVSPGASLASFGRLGGSSPEVAIPHDGRVLGLDLGTVRIGVALSDSNQRMATRLTTVVRGGDPAADRRSVARLVSEEEVVGVVVGVPVSLDGSIGPAARAALDEVAQLCRAMPRVAVETVDERLTTVAAYQAMGVAATGQGQGRASSRRGRRRAEAVRQQVDSVAAAIVLQSWLDRRAAAGSTAP